MVNTECIERPRRPRPAPLRWRRRGRRRQAQRTPYRRRMLGMAESLQQVLHLVEAVARDPGGVLVQALQDPRVAARFKALVAEAFRAELEPRGRRRG